MNKMGLQTVMLMRTLALYTKTKIILTDKTIFLQIHVISTNLDIPEPFHRICCLTQNDPMGNMSLHGNIYSFKLHQLDFSCRNS